MTGRRRRAHRPARRGQAALETAVALPLLLAIVFNFVAVMVAVEAKQRVAAAVSLATQASITVPVDDEANSCRFAGRAFFDTAYDTSYSYALACPGSGGSFTIPVPAPPPGQQGLVIQSFSCSGGSGGTNYFDGSGYPVAGSVGPPVSCTVTASYDFAKTPLAFAIAWKPTFTSTVTTRPPAVRQCSTASGC